MMKATIDFASCPDPRNCKIGGGWPAYNTLQSGAVRKIQSGSVTTSADNELDAKCTFFQTAISKRSQISGLSVPSKQDMEMFRNEVKKPPTRWEVMAKKVINFVL